MHMRYVPKSRVLAHMLSHNILRKNIFSSDFQNCVDFTHLSAVWLCCWFNVFRAWVSCLGLGFVTFYSVFKQKHNKQSNIFLSYLFPCKCPRTFVKVV